MERRGGGGGGGDGRNETWLEGKAEEGKRFNVNPFSGGSSSRPSLPVALFSFLEPHEDRDINAVTTRGSQKHDTSNELIKFCSCHVWKGNIMIGVF